MSRNSGVCLSARAAARLSASGLRPSRAVQAVVVRVVEAEGELVAPLLGRGVFEQDRHAHRALVTADCEQGGDAAHVARGLLTDLDFGTALREVARVEEVDLPGAKEAHVEGVTGIEPVGGAVTRDAETGA